MTKRILFLIVSDNDMWRDVEELGTAYMVSQARKYGHTALMMETQAAQYDNGIIEEYKPDLVVFPIYSLNRDAVYRICTEIRGAFSDLVLCVGGAFTVYYANYANYNAEAILQGCAAVNAVIRHEGEQIIIDLLDTLNDPGAWESINGLAYRNKDGIHVNDDNGERPDLNTLPFPARDLLRQKRLPFAQISTSRGCTARCSFCAYQLMWKAWRGRNITSVLDEIQQLVERDGIHAFNFVDGSFEDPGYNAERMAALAQGILDRKLQISYYIQMRAETSRKIPDALMRLLRDSGLSSVCPGLESANEDDLKLFRKAPAPDTMTYAVDFFRRHDVNVDPGFINFNAYSTPGNLERNIGFLNKYGFAANWDYIVKKTFVYEGTPLFNQYKLDGVLVKNDMGMPDFRFLDDAVGTLYQFVSSALKDGDENGRNGVFRQICHGTSTNFVYAACLRSLLGQAGNANGRETVMDYERNMSQIRKGLSGHTANWFSELIRLARQGWTDGDAREITETHLSEDAIKEALIGFRYQNQKLKSAARGQKWPQYCADIASRIY